MASVAKLKDGSLQLQGHGDVIGPEAVLRSPVLAKVAQHARNGAVKALPVKVDVVLLWLSAFVANDKSLEGLSGKQLAGTLMVRTSDCTSA